MRLRTLRNVTAIVVCCAALTVRGQAPTPPGPAPEPAEFEVASIHVVGADHGYTVFPNFPAAQFTAENMSMKVLIAIAFGIDDNRVITKLDWLDSSLYTIRARPEGEVALTEKQYQPLLQQMLKRRFDLVAHKETREVPGYILTVAKGGPKLVETPEQDAMSYILEDGLRSPSVSAQTLASLLTRPLGKPVVDMTGLTGHYKLDLKFARVDATDSTLPSIFTALQEQLGLRLEAQKVPEEILVIARVEKVPTEN